jgi:hypothetical protein
MPTEWDNYRLDNIYACTWAPFGIEVVRKGANKLVVNVVSRNNTLKTYTIKPGETIKVDLPFFKIDKELDNIVFDDNILKL